MKKINIKLLKLTTFMSIISLLTIVSFLFARESAYSGPTYVLGSFIILIGISGVIATILVYLNHWLHLILEEIVEIKDKSLRTWIINFAYLLIISLFIIIRSLPKVKF